MIECNMTIVDATKVDRNGRLVTREAWQRAIDSEQNKQHMIPVFGHIDFTDSANLPEIDAGIPMDKIVGFAECSWFGENINVNLGLINEALSDAVFMPAFEVKPEDIQDIDGVPTIKQCKISYFYATKEPALNTK